MRKFFQVSKMLSLSIVLNILIVITMSIAATAVCRYFDIPIDQYPWMFYLIFYSMIGFGGAFISLQLSRYMAKKVFRIRLLTHQSTSSEDQHIFHTVQQLSSKAGIPMPEVGIYQSNEINAFATGPSRSRSLVAVSSSLLNRMDQDELEGVLAHEIAHIQNGDMVTMALIQGIVNTMVLLAARMAATLVGSAMRRRSFWIEYFLFIFFQIVFNLIGSILVVNVFSRRREYRADAGGARLASRSKMVKALEKLRDLASNISPDPNTSQYNTLKISSKSGAGLLSHLLSTHPPLNSRIEVLNRMRI